MALVGQVEEKKHQQSYLTAKACIYEQIFLFSLSGVRTFGRFLGCFWTYTNNFGRFGFCCFVCLFVCFFFVSLLTFVSLFLIFVLKISMSKIRNFSPVFNWISLHASGIYVINLVRKSAQSSLSKTDEGLGMNEADCFLSR